ncbi:LmbE family protein [Streptomyces sp. NRRL F-4489]|uniref:PIG-L family deacetylase n=1 Tax=Streptomyces sp. NRRL F-4489 TaxID=1609095 RepID=UPI0007464DE2|nr:PIG-L family deacetylase [Streptomyces sp. NRRL F-4489]KUL35648.1 LmbE family protein [Streptomyces sp. NRRL F-4489]
MPGSGPSGPSLARRRLLQATGGAVLAATAGAGVWAWLSPDTTRPAPPAREQESAEEPDDQVFLHVIAHPDDGLFFMNPNLEQAIRSGARTVTVCLTGGESDGRNAPRGTARHSRVVADRSAFARARVNGLLAAHARMATGDPGGVWDAEARSVLRGFQVEVQTLRAAPQHQLVFLELVEARAVSLPRATSLRGLWLGAADTLPTLRPEGSPVQREFRYTRDQVTETLAALLDWVRPTVVRTLDPNAVHSPKDPPPAPDPRLAGLRYYDHQDHTASAHFTQAALARYWGSGRPAPAIVESYLGYEMGALPNDLDLAAARRKAGTLDVYGWADHRRCGDPAGCGDRKVGGSALNGSPRNWTRSTRLRAPGSNAWVRPARDGRLVAFAVLGGAAYCWAETAPGSGRFGAPARAGGQMLEGQLHAVRLPDGAFRLFASRTVLPGPDTDHCRELVTAAQTAVRRDGVPVFGEWESLGTPDPEPVRSLETGFPAAVAAPDGTVHVFARAWDGGIGHRSRARGGEWTPWDRLEGPAGVGTLKASPQVVDGIDACVDDGGLLHLVAPSAHTVQHWVSKEPGEVPRPGAATGLPEPAGPVSVVPLPGGLVRIAYRQADTARVLIAERQRAIGGWRVTAQCERAGGYGRVALAAAGGDRMVLAARDDAGDVRVAMAQTAPKPWQRCRLAHSAAAGVAADAAGRAVLVALGNDGRLYAARQQRAGQTAPFRGWRVQAASPERSGGAPG